MRNDLVFSDAVTRLQAGSASVWEVHDLARQRLADGEDIILLSLGDPDLPTLDSTIQHAVNSLKNGRTHYSSGAGEFELRSVIADIEQRTSGKPCGPDEVIIFPGATNAIFAVMSCLLNAGDEVAVPEPMYIGYRAIFDIIGARVRSIPLNTRDNFSLDADDIKASVTAKTRVIFLNTPGNPAGNIISADLMRELAAWCLQRNIWLACDEVYSMITFDERHVSLRLAAEALDNIIIIDGLSKSHAMTGWRLGWTVADARITDRLLDFAASTVFGCCQFIQDAARFALENDDKYMEDIRSEFRQRRDYACSRLMAMPGVRCRPPAAGIFIMADVGAVAKDGRDFADRLLQEAGVSVLPAEVFGESTKQFVRLSLALSPDRLKTAMDRIEKFIQDVTP